MKKGDKTKREIELEIRCSKLEDELGGSKQRVSELEKFIQDFSKPPAAPAQGGPAEKRMWAGFFGWADEL